MSKIRSKRQVKGKVLLAAVAGSAVLSFGSCYPFTTGNLIAPPECGADGGPPNCFTRCGTDGGPPGCSGGGGGGGGTDDGGSDAGSDGGTLDGGDGG